jgi:hypothetical protein
MVKNKIFFLKKECKSTKKSRKTTFLSRIFCTKKLIFNEKHRLNALFSHISYFISRIKAIFAENQ